MSFLLIFIEWKGGFLSFCQVAKTKDVLIAKWILQNKKELQNNYFQFIRLSGGKSLILLQFYKTYSIISWIGYKIYYLMKTP